MVDTLSPVEITSKKNIKRVSFSTFTSKMSLSGSHFDYTTTEQDTSVEERVIPVAIQVQNKKRYIVRLDSMLIKSTSFDTTRTSIILNVYAAGKRCTSSRIILVKTDGKVSTVYFANPVYFPPDTSYIGFTVTTRNNFSFSFYTNKKIQGYLYRTIRHMTSSGYCIIRICPGLPAPRYSFIIQRSHSEQGRYKPAIRTR